MREEDKRKVIVFDNNCVRTIAGVALIQRVRLGTIRADLDITDTIGRRSMYTCCTRVNFKTADQEDVHHCAGNQDQIKKDTGLPLLTAEKYAKEKTRWKNCVDRSLAKAS